MNQNARAPLGGVLALVLASAMLLPAHTLAVMAGVLALTIVMFAVGWPALLELPSPRGSGLIIAVMGLSALAIAYVRQGQVDLTSLLITLIAVSVFLSFAHEMLRPARTHLTLSISGTASGALLAIMTVTWLQAWTFASAKGPGPLLLLVSLTFGAAVAMLALALPVSGRIRIPVAIVGSALVAGVLMALLGGALLVIVLAVAGGAIIATAALSIFFLLERVIGAYDPRPFLAMSTAPLALVGILSMLFVRIALSYFPTAMGLQVIPSL